MTKSPPPRPGKIGLNGCFYDSPFNIVLLYGERGHKTNQNVKYGTITLRYLQTKYPPNYENMTTQVRIYNRIEYRPCLEL